MKIRVLSDITFDLIAREMESLSNGELLISHSYDDDLIASIVRFGQSDPEPWDALLIYSDALFHYYEDEYQRALLQAIAALGQGRKEYILVSNLYVSSRDTVQKEHLGSVADFMMAHAGLLEQLRQMPNVFFLDLHAQLAEIGLSACYNWNLGHLYQMPYSKKAVSALARFLTEYALFLTSPEKKVIIVDCDNTLWDGIIGEDGLDGIHCDKTEKGKLFLDFQKFLLQKKKDGFLLALCSKNNEPEVRQAFSIKQMPLTWDDFIITKVNWEDKYKSILQISDELGLGVDSFVFVDDSDFEIEAMRKLIPRISFIKFDEEYAGFVHLSRRFVFKRKHLTVEDQQKHEQYLHELKRKELAAYSTSFEEYIQSLELQFVFSVNVSDQLARISQLTEKTNQFNFNKMAYTPERLKGCIEEGWRIYSIRVSDRFGDLGLVGVILIKPAEKGQAVLENFVLSCRALGRGVEDAFFAHVLADLARQGLQLQRIEFKESERNQPARQFYEKIRDQYESKA
jgi:FkbH-like protein